MPHSDSSGKSVDLREDKNATLARRVTVTHLVSLSGYTPFFEVAGVSQAVTVTGNYFEFAVSTSGIAHGSAYRLGWVDPSGRTEVLCSGRILLV